MNLDGFSPTERFKKFATSFAGCDGGDPAPGCICFCGIEWGGGYTENYDFYSTDYRTLLPVDWSDLEIDFKYQFNTKLAKLFAALKGERVENFVTVAKKHRMMGDGSKVVKFNLYPLSFQGDKNPLWTEWIYHETGFLTKDIYRVWCQQHRFPMFKKFVDEYSPRAVICVGLGVLDAYLMAFGGVDNIYELKKNLQEVRIQSSGGIKRFQYVHINSGKTLLVITPFLGGRKYELNSNADLQEVGEWIRNRIKDITDREEGL